MKSKIYIFLGKLFRVAVISGCVFQVSAAFAYEVTDVCAEYVGTGKKYKVEANIFSGSELNSKTHSYDYNSFSKYVVIFWGKDQATVIELDSPFGVNAFGVDGKDQQGYKWNISTQLLFCNN